MKRFLNSWAGSCPAWQELSPGLGSSRGGAGGQEPGVQAAGGPGCAPVAEGRAQAGLQICPANPPVQRQSKRTGR